MASRFLCTRMHENLSTLSLYFGSSRPCKRRTNFDNGQLILRMSLDYFGNLIGLTYGERVAWLMPLEKRR